jgi:hypothetical protein
MKLSRGKLKVPYTMCGSRGDWTFQRNRFGQISYPRHSPLYRNTPAQKLVRGNFGAVSARWRTLSEDQRQVWLGEARHQKTRSRLGQRFRLGGFNYFVKVNVALANRGLPQLDLPPFESLEAQLALPLLSQRLLRPLGEVLIGWAPGPCKAPGPAPPPGG